jgi:hypothetical protein
MNHARLKRWILILCLSALSASVTAQSGGPAAGATVSRPPQEAMQNTAILAASVAAAAGIAALAHNSTNSASNH